MRMTKMILKRALKKHKEFLYCQNQVSLFSWVVLVEAKFSGTNMSGSVLIVDLDYFF